MRTHFTLACLATLLFFPAVTYGQAVESLPEDLPARGEKGRVTAQEAVDPSINDPSLDFGSELPPEQDPRLQGFIKEISKTVAEEKAPEKRPVMDERIGDFANIPWRGSMMFNEKQLEQLYLILNDVVLPEDFASLPVERLKQEEETDEKSKVAQPITSYLPAYFLQSIIYYGPGNWTAWVNGQRYRPDQKRFDNLAIERVTSNSVEFIWREPNLNDIALGWKSNFNPYMGTGASIKFNSSSSEEFYWDYISKDGSVLVDSQKGVVRFILSPKQSFKSYDMAIVEGRALGREITYQPGAGRKNERNQLTDRQPEDQENPAGNGGAIGPASPPANNPPAGTLPADTLPADTPPEASPAPATPGAETAPSPGNIQKKLTGQFLKNAASLGVKTEKE